MLIEKLKNKQKKMQLEKLNKNKMNNLKNKYNHIQSKINSKPQPSSVSFIESQFHDFSHERSSQRKISQHRRDVSHGKISQNRRRDVSHGKVSQHRRRDVSHDRVSGHSRNKSYNKSSNRSKNMKIDFKNNKRTKSKLRAMEEEYEQEMKKYKYKKDQHYHQRSKSQKHRPHFNQKTPKKKVIIHQELPEYPIPLSSHNHNQTA